jgi:hypothetical protein
MNKTIITLAFTDRSVSSYELETVNFEANFIASLFYMNLGKFRIPKVVRITVEFFNEPIMPIIIPSSELIKVCRIRWHVDFEYYFSIDEKNKRYLFLLNKLYDSLVYAGNSLGWPIDIFERSQGLVVASNFFGSFVIVNSKSSNDRNLRALVSVQMEERENVIFLEIFSGERKKSLEIFRLSIIEDDFSVIAHKIQWISAFELDILNKDQEIAFRYSHSTEKLTLSIFPKTHSLEYLKDELNLLNAKTSKEEYIQICNKRLQINPR